MYFTFKARTYLLPNYLNTQGLNTLIGSIINSVNTEEEKKQKYRGGADSEVVETKNIIFCINYRL